MCHLELSIFVEVRSCRMRAATVGVGLFFAGLGIGHLDFVPWAPRPRHVRGRRRRLKRIVLAQRSRTVGANAGAGDRHGRPWGHMPTQMRPTLRRQRRPSGMGSVSNRFVGLCATSTSAESGPPRREPPAHVGARCWVGSSCPRHGDNAVKVDPFDCAVRHDAAPVLRHRCPASAGGSLVLGKVL